MLPEKIKPMLAVTAPGPFDSDDYCFEIKWDGVRCLAFVEGGRVRLQSRHLLDITAQFPELAVLRELPDGTLLDGELVCLSGGKPDLTKVQQRVHLQNRHRIRMLSARSPVIYLLFDLLYLRGKSVMAESLKNRRVMLTEMMERADPPGAQISQAVIEMGRELFDAVSDAGLEGMMAKRSDSAYLPGKRFKSWMKIKPPARPTAD